MPYVFQTVRHDGTPHPRWRFQHKDWRGQKRTATGTTNRAETMRLANAAQAQQDEIR